MWGGRPRLGRPPPRRYLDVLAGDLHRLLPEVHADGGLGAGGEGAAAEAHRQAGLAHVRVPDDDDLEDARLHRLLQRGLQLHPGGAGGQEQEQEEEEAAARGSPAPLLRLSQHDGGAAEPRAPTQPQPPEQPRFAGREPPLGSRGHWLSGAQPACSAQPGEAELQLAAAGTAPLGWGGGTGGGWRAAPLLGPLLPSTGSEPRFADPARGCFAKAE